MRCCWDAGGGLATSKRLFTGLRLIVVFFDSPEESRRLLGPEEIEKGTRTGTCSTRPSSTIFEILTTDRDVKSSDDGLIQPTANHCSCESLTNLCRSRASFTHPTHLSHHLRTRRSLHVAPRLENSAMRDPVRNGRILSPHGDTGVRKEVPLGEMRTPYKILNTEDGTLHFICADHHPIQIDDESPATSHWSAHIRSF